MSLLQKILEWSEELPAWQSDAIARLLAKQSLETEDIDDLLALLKAEHGIPDAKGRKPNPLTANQIPAPTKATDQIELLAVKNMQHVNAIAENQCLSFGAQGMTVIYGDNGSGKSGYSRVLKRACRARDQVEAILPNVGGVALPEPDELLTDIIELDDWRKEVEQRKSGIDKKRKSGSITTVITSS